MLKILQNGGSVDVFADGGEKAAVDLPHVIPLGTGEPGRRAVAAVLPLRRTDGDGMGVPVRGGPS